MTTLPQLIDALAKVDGRDHATLTQFGRVLREAGLLPTGKRGGGAPRMSPETGATILMATQGAFMPKDGPKAVTDIRSYELCDTFPDEIPYPFSKISDCQNCGEAMAELISIVPEIIDFMCSDIGPDPIEKQGRALRLVCRNMAPTSLRVRIFGGNLEILLHHFDKGPIVKIHYQLNLDLFDSGFYKDFTRWDRQVQVTFSLKTLIEIHACVSGETKFQEIAAG